MIYTDEIIDRLLAHWRKKNQNSEMVLKDEFGCIQIDISKAQVHIKSVELYDLIGKKIPQCRMYVREIKKPELTSISKIVNAKHQKDYEEKVAKQTQIQQQLKYLNELCNKLIVELEIELNLYELEKDFFGDRIFLKYHFGLIFKQYGIDLDNEMLEAIFGKKEHITKVGQREKKAFIDNIDIASKGTRLNFSLPFQFAETQNCEAYGVFSAFFKRAAGQLKTGSNQPTNGKLEKSYHLNNPLYSEMTSMTILANCVAPLIVERMNNIEEYKKKKLAQEQLQKVFMDIKH